MALEYEQGPGLASQCEMQRLWYRIVTPVHELPQLVGQRRLHHRYHRRCNKGSSRYLKCFVISYLLVCSYQNIHIKVVRFQCKIRETGYIHVRKFAQN